MHECCTVIVIMSESLPCNHYQSIWATCPLLTVSNHPCNTLFHWCTSSGQPLSQTTISWVYLLSHLQLVPHYDSQHRPGVTADIYKTTMTILSYYTCYVHVDRHTYYAIMAHITYPCLCSCCRSISSLQCYCAVRARTGPPQGHCTVTWK